VPKTYTMAQQTGALALASVEGAEQAAERLGIDPRTIRRWQAAAGVRPELDVPSDALQSLYDLAVAKVTADVAAGRIKGTQLMTIVGIARDKLDRARRQAPPAEPDQKEPYSGLSDAELIALIHATDEELGLEMVVGHDHTDELTDAELIAALRRVKKLGDDALASSPRSSSASSGPSSEAT
jgi:DNA-binding transcriptional MerR regulator